MLLIALFACVDTTDTSENPSTTLELTPLLSEQLTGHFDSSDQANSNSAYYAVSLQSCPVDAPELGTDVLYVEQALVDNLADPYRQRLYVLEQVDEETVKLIVEKTVSEKLQEQQQQENEKLHEHYLVS